MEQGGKRKKGRLAVGNAANRNGIGATPLVRVHAVEEERRPARLDDALRVLGPPLQGFLSTNLGVPMAKRHKSHRPPPDTVTCQVGRSGGLGP